MKGKRTKSTRHSNLYDCLDLGNCNDLDDGNFDDILSYGPKQATRPCFRISNLRWLEVSDHPAGIE
ncbi:MAG: hypothetical protein CSA75_05635 [Sorangium cellulosum]|nr:MAG: hypothetical protein CSA75_05635 [Sorangium cellulosum]